MSGGAFVASGWSPADAVLGQLAPEVAAGALVFPLDMALVPAVHRSVQDRLLDAGLAALDGGKGVAHDHRRTAESGEGNGGLGIGSVTGRAYVSPARMLSWARSAGRLCGGRCGSLARGA